MSRPGLLVRFAGTPFVSCLLFLCYAAIIAGWIDGEVVWWVGLGTLGASIRTLSAVRKLRRYKAWRAEWEAMGATDEPQRPERERRTRWKLLTVAALLFLAIPGYLPQINYNEGLVATLKLLWALACLYMLFRVLQPIVGLMRRATKRTAEKASEKTALAPVEWTLGRASSSPSRDEAARKLPESCRRLLRS